MGLQSTKERTLRRIVYLSGETITMQDLIDIRDLSSFTEEELMQLYFRFYQLDTANIGLINNYQFLELEELKLTPMRPRLFVALELANTGFPSKGEYSQILRPGKRRGKDELGGLSCLSVLFKMECREKLFKKEMVPFPESKTKLDYKELHLSDDVFTSPYIDFKLFVSFLSALSPRSTLENKAKYMFRIFDFNADGEISKLDLTGGLKYLLTGSEINPADTEMIADKIIGEIDRKQHHKIDMEDFMTAMTNSDLVKNCSIYF